VVLVQVVEGQQQRGRAAVDDLLPERVPAGEPVDRQPGERNDDGDPDPRGEEAAAARPARRGRALGVPVLQQHRHQR
jgi:hypothetical protein